MNQLNVAILGAGSVRCSVPVIASLATYFGERPLDVRLYDADEERLDLFDRLARTAFKANKSSHSVRSSVVAKDALEDADRVLLSVNDNCARLEAKAVRAKLLQTAGKRISATLGRLLQGVETHTAVMSLQEANVEIPLDQYYRLDWPAELNEDERRAVPHQVLRWIRGDDYLYELFASVERSPLKLWLDDLRCGSIASEVDRM